MRVKSGVRGRSSEDLSFKCFLFSLHNYNSLQNHPNFSVKIVKNLKFLSLFFYSPTPKLTSLTQTVLHDCYVPGCSQVLGILQNMFPAFKELVVQSGDRQENRLPKSTENPVGCMYWGTGMGSGCLVTVDIPLGVGGNILESMKVKVQYPIPN